MVTEVVKKYHVNLPAIRDHAVKRSPEFINLTREIEATLLDIEVCAVKAIEDKI